MNKKIYSIFQKGRTSGGGEVAT